MMCYNSRQQHCHEKPKVIEVTKTTSSTTCCVAREVQQIYRLQKEASNETCLSCSGERLGENRLREIFNTRPFILYLPNGDEFSVRILDLQTFTTENSQSDSHDELTTWWPNMKSSIFRVEEITGNCARLRALKYSCGRLVGTCFCVTVDLCDFVGIQCFTDVYISNLCYPVD